MRFEYLQTTFTAFIGSSLFLIICTPSSIASPVARNRGAHERERSAFSLDGLTTSSDLEVSTPTSTVSAGITVDAQLKSKARPAASSTKRFMSSDRNVAPQTRTLSLLAASRLPIPGADSSGSISTRPQTISTAPTSQNRRDSQNGSGSQNDASDDLSAPVEDYLRNMNNPDPNTHVDFYQYALDTLPLRIRQQHPNWQYNLGNGVTLTPDWELNKIFKGDTSNVGANLDFPVYFKRVHNIKVALDGVRKGEANWDRINVLMGPYRDKMQDSWSGRTAMDNGNRISWVGNWGGGSSLGFKKREILDASASQPDGIRAATSSESDVQSRSNRKHGSGLRGPSG
ncbi:hypothetical protein Dda_8868 [Drechslerella dactyloides]|uniref:Uncharacterized protein n=1 Tax=Drechslerella dactyloides TaxID=74499 RepID=A0AAD6IQ26_DREDA|nr:hypothetical protein Dda_8868 [Drechslerella dactyloides]